MKKRCNKIQDLITAGAMTVIVLAVLIWNHANPVDSRIYESDSLNYYKGHVTRVAEESLTGRDNEGARRLGYQKLEVHIDQGPLKGRKPMIDNDVTNTHHIICSKGTRVIVKVDSSPGVKPFYNIYNYDRTLGRILLLGVFAALLIVVAGHKGLRSLLGLAFAMVMILGFLLPALFHGYSPAVVTFITATVIIVSAMTLLNGWSRKTWIAVAATVLGMAVASAVYVVFSGIMYVNGYNLEAAEELILIRQKSGLSVSGLLFVSIAVSSLGALIDIAMSVVSALFEIWEQKPDIRSDELFRSGMNIGRDLAGANCQTLILAFTGSEITTLMVIISYGYQFNQLINADFISIELLGGMTAAIAVILTVPFSAFLTALAVRWSRRFFG